jgi:hypothetical protein
LINYFEPKNSKVNKLKRGEKEKEYKYKLF